MKFVIEHLSKSFEKRKFSEILILHLMKGNLWAARQKRRWKNNAV